MSEGGTLTITESALLANYLETDNDPLRIAAVSDALNGRVSLDGTAIFYAQDGPETITGSFTYTLSDGTASGLVTIDVTAVNDPPTVTSDTATVEEGTALSVAVLPLLSNYTDPEDDTLEVSEVGVTGDGTISLDGSTITYAYDGTETTTTGHVHRYRRQGQCFRYGDGHREACGSPTFGAVDRACAWSRACHGDGLGREKG